MKYRTVGIGLFHRTNIFNWYSPLSYFFRPGVVAVVGFWQACVRVDFFSDGKVLLRVVEPEDKEVLFHRWLF